MNTASADLVELTDLHPSRDDLLGDVLAGLSGTPKRLPSKYFYDRRGSELFEEITRQPEYYLTRIELALLEAECANIAAVVGPRTHVVEYGSGSGRKTRLLLDALQDPVAYTPVEISRSALVGSVERLDREFGPVQMLPVLGDFTAGPSHTLPTGGTGRFFSGLRVADFLRRTSLVQYDPASLKKAAGVVDAFAGTPLQWFLAGLVSGPRSTSA